MTVTRNQLLRLAILVGALALVAGCVTNLTGLNFSHKLHADEADCATCHADGQPAKEAACAACHDIDRANPGESCRTCHTEGSYATQSARPASYGDISFDHGAHADVACADCHKTAGTSRNAGDTNLPMMKVCMSCHDGDTAPGACDTCHTATTAARAPASHTPNWPQNHADTLPGDQSCGWCHGESACKECHTNEPPRSHTPTWSHSGHGIAADRDQTRCAVCHEADECARCHELAPRSHYGARFALPLNANEGHALLAKERGGTRSCVVCHDRGDCSKCH